MEVYLNALIRIVLKYLTFVLIRLYRVGVFPDSRAIVFVSRATEVLYRTISELQNYQMQH